MRRGWGVMGANCGACYSAQRALVCAVMSRECVVDEDAAASAVYRNRAD
jgi:hypothetical protein